MPGEGTSLAAAVGEGSAARFGVRAVLAAVFLSLVAVPFGLLLFLVESEWRPLLRVDQGARDRLHEFAVDHAWFVALMRALSAIGTGAVYWVLFTAVAGWLLWRRLPRLAVFVAVTVAGSSLLNSMTKLAVNRARPVLPDPVGHASGLSFPSGHAQSAMVAYSVFLLVFLPVLRGGWRRLAIAVAVVIVLGIGFSRLALGVHYVSDVLAGYVLGAAWVAALTAAFGAWRRETGRPGVDAAAGLEPEQAQRITVHDPGERDPRGPEPPLAE
jgi:membrane-associated phospholipid phosphatase